jgi:hypothetical protein
MTTLTEPTTKPSAADRARAKEVEAFFVSLVGAARKEGIHLVLAYAVPLGPTTGLHGMTTTLPKAIAEELPEDLLPRLMDWVAAHARDDMPESLLTSDLDGHLSVQREH